MTLTTKMVQFGCNNTRMLSSTTGYTRAVFGASGGAQNNMFGLQGIDTVTDNRDRMDKSRSVKKDNKLPTREDMSRANQEKKSKINTAWKQFE